ncbi:aminotransferase [Alphaproteobacteria bacterium LSUCC0684]
MLNPAVKALTAPPVAVVQNWIAQYSGALGPLVDMSQAVPGYPPHPDLLERLGRYAADPASLGYGAIEGEDELREAYASHMSSVYAAPVAAEETLITSGCNQAFITAALTVAAPGDEVLMMRPSYFNHEATLKMMGIRTNYIDADAAQGFIPDPARISASITPATRALALVSPNNPTGAVYPADVLDAIHEICASRDIWLILDETYRDFLPDATPPHHLLAQDRPDGNWRDNVILLYSFSKAYCIPGHRLGAVTAGADIIAEMAKVMDNIQICAPRAAQRAVAPMIDALTGWRQENSRMIATRARLFRDVFEHLDGWEIASLGAYFGYVSHPGQGDSIKVAEDLVSRTGVLTIPGGFFGRGQERYLRFAFANAGEEAISSLPRRLEAFKG